MLTEKNQDQLKTFLNPSRKNLKVEIHQRDLALSNKIVISICRDVESFQTPKFNFLTTHLHQILSLHPQKLQKMEMQQTVEWRAAKHLNMPSK